MIQAILKRLAIVAEWIDIRDTFFFGGLTIGMIGGCMISPPWTFVVVGAVLLLKSWPMTGGE